MYYLILATELITVYWLQTDHDWLQQEDRSHIQVSIAYFSTVPDLSRRKLVEMS